MIHSRNRQQGAATIIGVVFLISVISLMLTVILHMAGSSINDTSMQNDSVEALFIAESGLEQASFLYGNGTACSDLSLAPNNTGAIGRGNYTITTSLLVGSLCRVQIQGDVSQTFTVQRFIEADLRKGGSGTAWAIGQNGVILYWDGSVWSTSASLGNDLSDVFCISSNDCWAIGDRSGGSGTIAHWNGSSWSTSGFTNNSPNEDLYGIHCVASNDCWAVGNKGGGSGTIVRWNGSSWSTSGFTNNSPNEDLNGVHCIASNDCWAVGDRGGGTGSIAHWNGTSWSTAGITNGSADDDLMAVHCSPAGSCWAVGKDGSAAQLSAGTTWTANNFGGNDLNAVYSSGSASGATGVVNWWEMIN